MSKLGSKDGIMEHCWNGQWEIDVLSRLPHLNKNPSRSNMGGGFIIWGYTVAG